jgi:hypothetical protein
MMFLNYIVCHGKINVKWKHQVFHNYGKLLKVPIWMLCLVDLSK